MAFFTVRRRPVLLARYGMLGSALPAGTSPDVIIPRKISASCRNTGTAL